MCRFEQTPEMKAMHEKCEPYLIRKGVDVSFAEGTPDEIKILFENWKQMWKKMHEEICGY